MPTFAEYLRPLAVGLPPELVSPRTFAVIHSIASILPGALAYGPMWLECRLGEDAPRADFSVSANTLVGGREALLQLDPALLGHPIWRQIHNFATAWADPSSPLYENVDNFCLEFDVAETPAPLPLPGVFFGFRSGPDYSARQSRAYLDDISVTQAAVELLTGRTMSRAYAETLSRCFRLLPSHAKKTFIGIMLSRNETSLRFVVRGLDLGEMFDYLERIGWQGSLDDLRASFAGLSDLVDFFWLCIDIDETIGPKIGVECYCRNYPHEETKWPRFLDYLVERGCCTPARYAALLRSPGSSPIESHDTIWPESLRQASQLLAATAFTKMTREIRHIKLVHQPQQALEAKVYLQIEYR